MRKPTRREFLLGGAALTGVTIWPAARSLAAPVIDYPFTLGVASGEPYPDSVVLWTRLAPVPLAPDGLGGMPDATFDVEWQLANDSGFTDIVASGVAPTYRAIGYSVHVTPPGLRPGAHYFYRFRTGGHTSPVGRTRTAPAAGSAVSRMTFCFASCQHFEEGYYHAHRSIANDAPDLVLFLGDYTYERVSGQPAEYKVRSYAVRTEATKLANYRHRYAQYRTDPDLRAAHAAAPWCVVFDDHEVRDNWWNGFPDPGRRADAYQAFYENMPLRSSSQPGGAGMRLYRSFEWGNLARFFMLDTRQYRDQQPTSTTCTVHRNPARSITGVAQEQWLLNAFETHPATWDILGQQVFFSQHEADADPQTCGANADHWDAYQASRTRITKGWMDRGVPNPVVLTGDVHRHWAANLRLNYYDRTSPIVGSELVCGSVTSSNRTAAIPTAAFQRDNPHIKYCLSQKHGYVRATVTPQRLTAEFIKHSTVFEPSSANVVTSVDATYTIEAGLPGLQGATLFH